jgi:hypothetical protein
MQAPRSPLGGHAGRCRREWIFEMGCTSRPARDLYAAIPPGGWHKPLLCYSATPPLHYSITPLAPSKLMPRRCDGLLTDINTRLGKDRSMMCGCGPSDLQAISNCSSPIPHPWRSCRDRSSASDPLPERRLVPVLEVLHAIPILMARHRPLCEMSQLGSLERCGVSGHRFGSKQTAHTHVLGLPPRTRRAASEVCLAWRCCVGEQEDCGLQGSVSSTFRWWWVSRRK